jgi:uncharacterized protein YbaP (TraB family)
VKYCVLVVVTLLALGGAARGEPAIWLVQGATSRIYLFGTMHILPKQGAWFGPKIAAAFADSQELWEEADVGLLQKQSVPRIMDQAVAPNSDLWAKLPPATAEKFRGELKTCHLPPTVVAHFRPWFATMLPTICQLTEQSAKTLVDGANGPEGTLLTRAKSAGKPTKFFETAEQQIGYLADAPESVQLKQLRDAIDQAATGKDDFAGIETAWLAGDEPAIARQVADTKKTDPDFYATIFTQRNQRFAAKIAELMAGNVNIFVAIGAGHLAGPDSVQAQLKKLNVAVKRL